MNWTGGRLQRHSKANSDARVKAQRDYFARARLRQSTKPSAPTPLHISISAASHRQEQSGRSLARSDRKLAIDEGRSQKDRRRLKTPKRVVNKISASDQTPTHHRGAKVQSSHGTTSPRVNTLAHVKKSLLKQSDWLGLAGARPPKPDHTHTAIPEQIARRRTVTREDKHRQKHCASRGRIEHNFIKHFPQPEGVGVLQPKLSENPSIRIGSNIHQSQATTSQRPPNTQASAVPESSSTEPMLFDIAEPQVPPATNESGEYYLKESNNAGYLAAGLPGDQNTFHEDALIPLEQVRDFASFDEIKRYSSSAKHTASSSRSGPKQQFPVDNGSQTRSLQQPSSSLVNVKTVDDQGLYSSNGNSHKLASIGSEPPGLAKHLEDAMMQDMSSSAAMAHASGTGREECELRSIETRSAASQKSSLAFERPSRSGSLPGDAAMFSRSNPNFRDVPPKEVVLNREPRSLYTIERQAQLEEALDQQNHYLTPSVNSRSNVPIDLNMQQYRVPHEAEKELASEDRDCPTRHITPEAMAGIYQTGPLQSSHPEKSLIGTGHRGQGDENEAWMRDVFSTDFDKLQQRFSFAKAPTRRATAETPPRIMSFRESRPDVANRPYHPEWRIQSSQRSSELSLPMTIKTGVNTVLNVQHEPERNHQRNIFLPSETDFLTQMSPMTGYLDDRIINLSTYNNAADTVREFVESQPIAAKRTASRAFGDSSYDQYDTNSSSEGKVALLSSPVSHRAPLNTLHQAPLRPRPFDISQVIREDPQDMSRTVWRHAETLSPIEINRSSQPLISREQFEHSSIPFSQAAWFPMSYTPPRISSYQSREAAQVERPQQTLHLATSKFSPQSSPPTRSSQHRVTLTPRITTKMTDFAPYEHQSLTGLTSDRKASPLAPFEIPMSSRSAGLTPTSSSPGVSTRAKIRPVTNIHTNQGQQFVFKRPQRLTTQSRHHSRAAPQFRVPPSIPLH